MVQSNYVYGLANPSDLHQFATESARWLASSVLSRNQKPGRQTHRSQGDRHAEVRETGKTEIQGRSQGDRHRSQRQTRRSQGDREDRDTGKKPGRQEDRRTKTRETKNQGDRNQGDRHTEDREAVKGRYGV
jgi:hypothetical protein